MTRFATILVALPASAQVPAATSPTPSNAASAANQTVRLMNEGNTGIELAEVMELPPSLQDNWSTRGYCGTMSHDTEVVYQRYMGWYDRNPPNLHALPPVPVAKNYVEYMGGRGGEAGRVREPGQPGGEAAARGRARADGDARHLPRLAQHRDAVNASHEYRLMTRADSVISRA